MSEQKSSELQTFLLNTLNMVYSGLNNQSIKVQSEFAQLLKAQKISSDESAFFRTVFDKSTILKSIPSSLIEKLNDYPELQSLIKTRSSEHGNNA